LYISFNSDVEAELDYCLYRLARNHECSFNNYLQKNYTEDSNIHFAKEPATLNVAGHLALDIKV